MRGCGLQCVTHTGLYKMLLLSVESLITKVRTDLKACMHGRTVACIFYTDDREHLGDLIRTDLKW